MPAAAQSSHEKDGKENDNPRARQEYLEELRGADTGIPPGARLNALREMDQMIRQEGERFWRERGFVQGMQPSGEGAEGGEILSGAAYEAAISNGTPSSSQWLFIGPRPTNDFVNSSGRTAAIVVDSRDATGNTVYVGGAQGGVWKTTDGGTTWTPLTDSQASLATGSMAIDPTTDPSTVYVGTGEQSFAFDAYYGAGVLRSTDGGTTWTQLGADKFAGPISGCSSSGFICGGAFIGGLSVRPGGSNPAHLLAAVSLPAGFPNGPGIYRTTDGGTTWTNVLAGTTSLGATAVQFATNMIAYAGLDSLGVYKSTDGGATWNPANGAGPSNTITPAGRVELSVALSDASGNTVYASVGAASGGSSLSGFYKTTDGGVNWTKLGPVSAPGLVDYCSGQCWYDNVVAVNPVNASVVFVGGSAVSGHVSKTIDGGTNWASATSSIHVDHHAAAFTPNGSKLYWGNDGGVYSTTDTGTGNTSATWTNLNSTLGMTQFYSYFGLHPTDVNITLGGTQDNGTQKYDGTLDIGLAWTRVTCGDGASAVIDHFNPSIVYANCQNIDVRKSTSGGSGGFSVVENGINAGDRVTFIPPMVGDNNTSALNFVYFGTHQVYQTRDSAVSWQRISNDVTGGASTISNMAVAPGDRSVMYVVTRDGRVAKGTNLLTASPNDCGTLLNCFTDVTGDLQPSGRRLNAVAVSPTDANAVYVGHSGFGSTSRHISRSTTGGTTWTDITNNLPNTPVNDIVVDPDIAGTLYVGTDIGVFRSIDNGASWSTLANGLPRVAVYGLKLHKASRTLRAATHGRGFWDLSVPVSTTGPGALLSPSSLNFTTRPLNSTSPAQNVSFTNNGTAPTTVSGVTASGDFAVSSNGCTSAVAAGDSCTIGVTFTPTVAGQRSGTLTATSNAATSPTTASLSGLGAPPNDNFANAVVVDSGSFAHSTNTLGATTEGSDPTGSCDFSTPTRSKSVWYFYTPASSGQATIHTQTSNYDTVLAVFTGTTGSFAEVANGCNDDINNVPESPSSVTISVTGGTTYRIMVSGFVPNDGGTLNFSVSGPAPAPPSASLTITPGTLNFGSRVVGTTSSAQAFTLTAAGGTVSSIVVATATGDFARTHNCPSSLTVGTSCTVAVTFTPTATGARNGGVQITSNGTGSPQSVTLSGTGTAATLTISASSLTFTGQGQGTTSPAEVLTLTATTGPVNSLTVAAATGDFARTTSCPASLAHGSSCTVSVTFTPTGAGTRNGSISITSTASGSPQSVSLTGTGDTVSLAPATLILSAVLGRPTTPQPVTFFNGSGGTVTFTSIGVTGDYTQTNNCVSVSAGGTCTINVIFTPAGTGARNGVLTVNSSAGTRTATLNGTGVEFSLTLARPLRPARNGNGSAIVIEPGKTAVVELVARSSTGEAVRVRCYAAGGVKCTIGGAMQGPANAGVFRVLLTADRPIRAGRLQSSRESMIKVEAEYGGVVKSLTFQVNVVRGF